MNSSYDNSFFKDTTKFYSNNDPNLHKASYLHHNRNELNKADSLEDSSEYYDNKYQRFKKLICPKTICAMKRADYLREFDVPGAKPLRLIPIKGRDTLNISDIEGACPRRSRVRNAKFDSMLYVKDINSREEFKKKSDIKINDFCLNFSNPHLEKPRWHRNIKPKAESNNYSWSKPSIQKLIRLSWNDYNPKHNWDPNKPEAKLLFTNRRNSIAHKRRLNKLIDHYRDSTLHKDSERNYSNELRESNKTPLNIERNMVFCIPQKSEYLKKSIEKM